MNEVPGVSSHIRAGPTPLLVMAPDTRPWAWEHQPGHTGDTLTRGIRKLCKYVQHKKRIFIDFSCSFSKCKVLLQHGYIGVIMQLLCHLHYQP